MTLTAAHIAVVLVAAAKRRGTDPAAVFDDTPGARLTRILAGAACVQAGLASYSEAARAIRITTANQFAPSQLTKRGLTAEDVAHVVRALTEAGLAKPAGPLPAAPEAADAPSRDKPARADKAARPDPAPEPVPVRRVGSGWMPKGPRYAGKRAADADRAFGGGGRWTGPRDGVQKRVITRQGPGTARPSASPIEAARGTVRLKPVTDRIARWAGFFPPECWSHDEVAALFGVHPDALLDAMDPPASCGEAA